MDNGKCIGRHGPPCACQSRWEGQGFGISRFSTRRYSRSNAGVFFETLAHLCAKFTRHYASHGAVFLRLGGGDLSYAWASLRGAKSILLEGLGWRVGNGQTIKVWRDDWNPKKKGLFVPKESTLEDSGLRVADLIDSQRAEWRIEELARLFEREVLEAILSIRLSHNSPKDTMFWWPEKEGLFSVKSAYWLGMLGHIDSWVAKHGPEGGEIWRRV